jgi:hypothetical protein
LDAGYWILGYWIDGLLDYWIDGGRCLTWLLIFHFRHVLTAVSPRGGATRLSYSNSVTKRVTVVTKRETVHIFCWPDDWLWRGSAQQALHYV